MLGGLAKLLRGGRREYEVFQVEVSTYSSLDCQVCPRAVFAEEWEFEKMSLETFGKIRPHLPLARWVSFRGWGEPLENEAILPMLRSAKEAGCSTRLTSNGSLLTEDLSRELVDTGLDEIVIHLELATQRLEEPLLRKGSDIRRILDQAEALIRRKQNSGRKQPSCVLSLPMTRLNMRDLPGFVGLAAKLGADQAIFCHLDYLPDERWNILRAFYHESPTPEFQEILEEVHRLAKAAGLAVISYPLKAEEVPVCEPDPPNNVFFAADGSIAPCPYLRIPKKGDIPRIFMNAEHRVPQTFFGKLGEEDFLETWEKESYREFRRIFEERRKASRDALDLVEAFSNPKPSGPGKEAPPLSEVCRTCYKAYGL